MRHVSGKIAKHETLCVRDASSTIVVVWFVVGFIDESCFMIKIIVGFILKS